MAHNRLKDSPSYDAHHVNPWEMVQGQASANPTHVILNHILANLVLSNIMDKVTQSNFFAILEFVLNPSHEFLDNNFEVVFHLQIRPRPYRDLSIS